MRLSAETAVAEYEAQQRAMIEREDARKQQELERQRQEVLLVAEQARSRRESLEKQAMLAKQNAERLRAEALAAQQELERQEEIRKAKILQREESRRLREEAQRREANRLKAEEEERLAFEAKKQAEQLRLDALRLTTQASATSFAPSTASSGLSRQPSMTDSGACSKCYAALKATQKFCLHCGTKREVSSASTPPMRSNSGFNSSFYGSSSAPSPAAAPASSGSSHACKTCQFELKATQKFCPKCGSAVVAAPAAAPTSSSSSRPPSISSLAHAPIMPPAPSASSMYAPAPTPVASVPTSCSSCHQALKPTQKFCLHCGTKVVIAAPASAPMGASAYHPSSVALPAPIPVSSSGSFSSLPTTKNCKTCGAQCKYNAKFCVGCGFNFAKDEEDEVARNLEAARQRSQVARDRELQQRNNASMIANQAAQSHQGPPPASGIYSPYV